MTTVERAYTYLYHARNAFLHGNPVAGKSLLTRTAKKQVGIPLLASMVLDLPRFNGRVSDRHYAACCHCSSYSAGLMYPNVEWRRFRLYQVSM